MIAKQAKNKQADCFSRMSCQPSCFCLFDSLSPSGTGGGLPPSFFFLLFLGGVGWGWQEPVG